MAKNTGPDGGASSAVQRIVQSAIDEFGERGFDLATMDNVAIRAGTSKQLVYYYFKTKEVLYSEAMDEISRIEHRALLERDYDSLPPLVALDRFFLEILKINLQLSRLHLADQIIHFGTGRMGGNEVGRQGRRACQVLDAILNRGKVLGVVNSQLTVGQVYLHMLLLSSGFHIFRPLMRPYTGEDFALAEASMQWGEHARQSILAAVQLPSIDPSANGEIAQLIRTME